MQAYSTLSHRRPRSLRGLAERLYFEEGRRPIAPLLGYPGLNLTRTSVKQNQFNHAVQYQTVARLYETFRPDAMLFLMDLSVEASALGLPVRFPLDETPTVEAHPVKSRDDLDRFRRIDILADGRVMVYLEVMGHMRAGLPVPVGAYVTGPFTLAGLMMDATQLAMDVVLEPDLCQEVLEFAAATVTRYARALVDQGADFIVILDPTAVMLGPQYYSRFAGAYAREVIGLLDDVEVILHICGDTSHLLDDMAATGAAGLSLDHPMDLAAVARQLGPQALLVGNLDPVRMLTAGPAAIAEETQALLGAVASHPRFVLSSGCDLPQDTPLATVDAFMQAGRRWAVPTSARLAARARDEGAAAVAAAAAG